MANVLRQSIKTLFFLAIFISLAFINVHAESIWEKRKKAVEEIIETPAPVEEVEEAEEMIGADSIDPSAITIPDQYGTILETHRGTNGKLIVHIQDAHMNYEAQKNEAHVLESLIRDYDLTLILLEGKVSDLNFDRIRKRALLYERTERADKLLKNGDINGVNYLNIASNYPMVIQGIEDIDVYDKNINMLWEIDKFKDIAGEYVEKLTVAANKLKPQIYNKGLLELDNKKKEYDEETIDLLEYYEYLYEKAKESTLPLYVFPNFQNLIRASELEKQIDLVNVRSGDATTEEMTLYNDYMDATKNLNVNALFKEEPRLEEALQDILAENADQKRLLNISKALSIIRNLLKIKAVPEEYDYFEKHKNDFDPKSWESFLEEKSKELGIDITVPSNHYAVSDNLQKIEEFYGIAAERNKVFVRRTNEHINNEGVRLAALVAGGFHTPMLTKLFADSGYSYVVISPRVTTETDDNLYRSALKREWIPEIKRRGR